MVFVKKSTFVLYVLFLAKQSQKQKVFDVLYRKKLFFRPEKSSSKKVEKIDILQRG